MTIDPFASVAQFLAGGLTAAKFPSVGFTVEGTVTAAVVKQQTDYDDGTLLTWDDGSPKMQMIVDLKCEPTFKTWETIKYTEKALPQDDGMRALYVKGNLQRALQAALRQASAKFEIGGRIKVTRIPDGPRKTKSREPAYEFAVEWTPANKNAASAADFLAEPATDENPFAKGAAPF